MNNGDFNLNDYLKTLLNGMKMYTQEDTKKLRNKAKELFMIYRNDYYTRLRNEDYNGISDTEAEKILTKVNEFREELQTIENDMLQHYDDYEKRYGKECFDLFLFMRHDVFNTKRHLHYLEILAQRRFKMYTLDQIEDLYTRVNEFCLKYSSFLEEKQYENMGDFELEMVIEQVRPLEDEATIATDELHDIEELYHKRYGSKTARYMYEKTYYLTFKDITNISGMCRIELDERSSPVPKKVIKDLLIKKMYEKGIIDKNGKVIHRKTKNDSL
ncbi:MAG: hypothetical protein V1870_05735 [Candidatus Aenigmatarchaeota archaeon]